MTLERRHHPRRRVARHAVSACELLLSEDHDGIIELPADAPVGAPYADCAAARRSR